MSVELVVFTGLPASGKTTFYQPTREELAAWQKALDPVTQDMRKRLGADLIDEFRSEAQAVTN